MSSVVVATLRKADRTRVRESYSFHSTDRSRRRSRQLVWCTYSESSCGISWSRKQIMIAHRSRPSSLTLIIWPSPPLFPAECNGSRLHFTPPPFFTRIPSMHFHGLIRYILCSSKVPFSNTTLNKTCELDSMDSQEIQRLHGPNSTQGTLVEIISRYMTPDEAIPIIQQILFDDQVTNGQVLWSSMPCILAQHGPEITRCKPWLLQ